MVGNSLWVSEAMRKWCGDCEWRNTRGTRCGGWTGERKRGTTKTGGDTGPI